MSSQKYSLLIYRSCRVLFPKFLLLVPLITFLTEGNPKMKVESVTPQIPISLFTVRP